MGMQEQEASLAAYKIWQPVVEFHGYQIQTRLFAYGRSQVLSVTLFFWGP